MKKPARLAGRRVHDRGGYDRHDDRILPRHPATAKRFGRWPVVSIARFDFDGDAADARQIRDRLADKLFIDGEAAATLLALSLNALAALHSLRGQSIISRRTKAARAAATALVRLAQSAGEVIGK
jgi:hypothetical protein